MKHKTRWQPDTCQCDLTYEWDDEVNPPVFELVEIHRRCPFHSLITLADGLGIVGNHNRNKNRIIGKIVETQSDLIDKIQWNYDDNNVLNIVINYPLTVLQENVVRNWVSNNIVGQVNITVIR